MARREPPTSSRARGKAPTVQVEQLPPAELDKELAHRLQVEEVVAEEACQGRDAATCEVVVEAACPLMQSAGRFGGMFQAGASRGSWPKLAICSCDSSATRGGGLATLLTFTSSGWATACNVSYGSVAAHGFSCS